MILLKNIVVIIPCYEPSEKNFVSYVKELLKTEIQGIVIVNDGSGEKYRRTFDSICSLDKDRIFFIDYQENRGKGYALKKAFAFCLENFSEESVFVTADCDGQHIIKDVINVAKESEINRGAFILGSRDFTLSHVPARSRTGNRNTSRFMRFLYGIEINDTQTGLRGFSYSLLKMLIEISGDRFEYETNQLIILHRKQVSIKEVPIETIYEDKADDVEKVSHFKTFRDSAKVIGVLIKNLGWYFFSSILSSVIDVGVFAFMFWVLQVSSLTLKTLIATVTARVVSSLVNFTFNYKFVFSSSSHKSLVRYYILWFFQLIASFSFARLWAQFITIKTIVSLLKAISDILLALLSYQIQSRWVFANKTPPRWFYGGLMGFSKGLYNFIFKKYDAKNIPFSEDGSAYICRHLNMHGCYTTVSSLTFDVHIFAFHMFFKFKDAYKQYSEITYAKNGKTTAFAKIKAFFSALYVPKLLNSAKAIPVYRNSMRSTLTIKEASKCLRKKESVLLFPDIDYKASQEVESEIYKGFLLLEKNYYKTNGKHLKFIPLYIDDNERKVYEYPPITFDDGDMKEQLDAVAEKIRLALQRKPNE